MVTKSISSVWNCVVVLSAIRMAAVEHKAGPDLLYVCADRHRCRETLLRLHDLHRGCSRHWRPHDGRRGGGRSRSCPSSALQNVCSQISCACFPPWLLRHFPGKCVKLVNTVTWNVCVVAVSHSMYDAEIPRSQGQLWFKKPVLLW